MAVELGTLIRQFLRQEYLRSILNAQRLKESPCLLQKVVEAAASVLNHLLSSLVSYYMICDPEAMPCIPWTASQGVPVEAWIHLKGRRVPESVREGMKPKWHVATADEVPILRPFPWKDKYQMLFPLMLQVLTSIAMSLLCFFCLPLFSKREIVVD